ncbi:MAG: C40 family peptidase, partial [Betaproteobacteria bacterium]|nr:C40 family peptidase [Betaproteobacteria bacterium]
DARMAPEIPVFILYNQVVKDYIAAMRRYSIVLMVLALLPLSAIADDSNPTPGPEYAPAASTDVLGQAQEIVLRALSFIGVRYKWGGTSPESGFDCSGLIRYVYTQVTGQPFPYNAQEMSRVGDNVAHTELQPGDLVFFNTLRKPFSHVGIYLGESRFVHAPSRGGHVEISDMGNRYWKARYNGARRLPL